jgi:hypothetical protein
VAATVEACEERRVRVGGAGHRGGGTYSGGAGHRGRPRPGSIVP